ncbi:phage protein Gp27 family protein [Pseudomonas chlororaphis]|uniref:phage protein Gp27 family protein n=1 Tax=Pseudomonas chlororaphis TaxID=587753 RepID=UPI000F58CF4F|nr:phage protein Gp27 family protein [Pseudomonas chlororaphis]
MAGKSSINRLPPMVKAYIQKLLREDRMTLDDMLADIQSRFPNEKAPSRSALGRFKQGFDLLTEKTRQHREQAEAFVGAFGEDASDKTGALLVEAISTLAYQAAMGAHEKDDVTTKEVAELARAAKNTMQARTLSIKERQAIEKAAQERLIQEQQGKLDDLGKSGALTPDTLQRIRQEVYGL